MVIDITSLQKRKKLRIDNNNKKMPIELFYYPFFFTVSCYFPRKINSTTVFVPINAVSQFADAV